MEQLILVTPFYYKRSTEYNMKYVFKLLNQPNTDLNLNLDDLYIGEYQKSITGDLVIKINSNVQETESYDFLIPTDKAEKLYTWQ